MKLQFQGREFIVTQTKPVVAVHPVDRRTLEILRINKSGIIIQTRKVNFDLIGVEEHPAKEVTEA